MLQNPPPTSAPLPPAPAPYPATLDVDYPTVERNRLSVAFRIFLIIPIMIILALLTPPGYRTEASEEGRRMWEYSSGAIVLLPTILMLLFRRKYPKWWYDWNIAFTRFTNRIGAYFALLRDEYPSTDEEQAVHVEVLYPDAKQLSRWMPLVKWFLVIPHIIVLIALGFGALFVIIIAWFAILFTGKYPRGMFDYVVGVMRWGLRVQAYSSLLTTDRYPPFSLS